MAGIFCDGGGSISKVPIVGCRIDAAIREGDKKTSFRIGIGETGFGRFLAGTENQADGKKEVNVFFHSVAVFKHSNYRYKL